MSLNRYEQCLFSYLEVQPDERRHWQMKVMEAVKAAREPARELERELWAYLVERSEHVPALRALVADDPRRVSLQNLADLILRLWGPLPKPKRPAAAPRD